MLVHLGTAPLAHPQHLGVGFGKSLNALFHSSCVYLGTVTSHLSLAWHCSGWQNWEGRFFPFYQGGRVSSLLRAATREFISEIMLWPVRRGWWPHQEWEMSQCGIDHPMLLFSMIQHPSVELSISWGGMQRKGVKGQAKIFWLLLGLPCCESYGLRFCVNPFLLNPAQNLRNYLSQPTSPVVLHWNSSSWGAAGMTTKKQQYTMTQQGKQ